MGSAAPVGGEGGAGRGLRVDATAASGGGGGTATEAARGGGGGLREVLFLARSSFL
jgi:hypothetical protein